MPGDLAIDSVAAASYASGSSTGSTRNSESSAAFAADTALPAVVAAKAAPLELANPRLHTDLALNRLVLEFFDAQGDLTHSIPSQKQLDAYRIAASSGLKDAPDT